MTSSTEPETISILKSFTDFDDAVHWMDHEIRSRAAEGWEVIQGSSLGYVNHKWRVGLVFDLVENGPLNG